MIIGFPDRTELASVDERVHSRLSELVGHAVHLHPLPPVEDKAQYRRCRLKRWSRR